MGKGIDFTLHHWLKIFSIQICRPFSTREFLHFMKGQAKSLFDESCILEEIENLINEKKIESNTSTLYISKIFPELDILYEFLGWKRQVLSKEKILKVLKNQEKIILLEDDVRFINIKNSDYWILSEWKIVNDEVYELLEMLPEKQDLYEELKAEFEDNRSGYTKIFLPHLDNRFIIRGDFVLLNDNVESEDLKSDQMHSDGQNEHIGDSQVKSPTVDEYNVQVVKKEIVRSKESEIHNSDLYRNVHAKEGILDRLFSIIRKIFKQT